MLAIHWTGCLVVGLLWGFTNPFLKKGSEVCSNKQCYWTPKLYFDSPFITTLYLQLAQFLDQSVLPYISTPQFIIPFLLNAIGSCIYMILLAQTELSITLPTCGALSFIGTVVVENFLFGQPLNMQDIYGALLILSGLLIALL